MKINWRRLEDDLRTLLSIGYNPEFPLESATLPLQCGDAAEHNCDSIGIDEQFVSAVNLKDKDETTTDAAISETVMIESPPSAGEVPSTAVSMDVPVPVISTTTNECKARFAFSRSLVGLLREAPKTFKEIYPVIAALYPQYCGGQGHVVSANRMEWLGILQSVLQTIAVFEDGRWQLKEADQRQQRRRWDYATIVEMWNQGASLDEINEKIDRFDLDKPDDPNHSLRNCLWRLRKKGGYRNAETKAWIRVDIQYRVQPERVENCRIAGFRAVEKKSRLLE